MSSFCLSLPKTSFAMRGNLPQQEPQWLDFWEKHQCYSQRKHQNRNNTLFVLQDGPPYANGPIHMGHALNKVLKDVVQRHEFFHGQDVCFIPGWDCHGLPIENHVEKELLKEKKSRKDLTPRDFRQRCRQSAEYWISEQKKGFQRLGIMALWNKAYTTMDFSFEAGIVDRLFQLLKKGYIYQGFRPVLWSPAEQTALAEAEVEYQDITSPSLYVRFPVVHTKKEILQDTSVVIWTTTPWSLPGNQGVAYGDSIVYGLYKVQQTTEHSLGIQGEKILIAQDLAQEVFKETGILEASLLGSFKGEELEGTSLAHPLWAYGFPKEVPFIPSEFVTTSAGTGLVHTAPAHGMEDFIVGQRYNLPLYNPLSSHGVFLDDVPLVGGMHMDKVFESTLKPALLDRGMLLAQKNYLHSYPHSWRSKKPLFYFLAKQWFLTLDGPLNLRERALKTLPEVKWHPGNAYRRMEATLRSRPDWCISRQRLWGVPLAFFINEKGEILQHEGLFHSIVNRIKTQGCDFWFNGEAQDMLPEGYSSDIWKPVQDIVDVWVESGLVSSLILLGETPENCHRGTYSIDSQGQWNSAENKAKDSMVMFRDHHEEDHPENLEKDSTDISHSRGQEGSFGNISKESGVLSFKNCGSQQGENRRQWPANLYIEGSDQHRAWFQSSLTLSMALHDSPPYKEVLTHGFILDEKGQKMSKSLGNVLDPMDIVEKKGADILRLWVVYSDYQKDMLVGANILSRVEDLYRRFRNTLRYLLGSLHGWHPQESKEPTGTLEKWILHKLYDLQKSLGHCYGSYDFRSMIHILHGFCNEDLSAFYFHSLKDVLYCDNPKGQDVQEIRTVLYRVFLFLVHWLGSFLPFTTEEAWQCLQKDILQGNNKGIGVTAAGLQGHEENKNNHGFSLEPWCLHLNNMPIAPSSWIHEESYNDVQEWKIFREAVCTLSEKKREDIPDLLQGLVKVYINAQTTLSVLKKPFGKTLGEGICALSELQIIDISSSDTLKNCGEYFSEKGSFSISLEKNNGEKCQRCWKKKSEVSLWRDHMLCLRCQEVEGALGNI